MTGFEGTFTWAGSSSDPNDQQFGDVVTPVTLETVDRFSTVLVGEPYDGAVIGRQGAREGPDAIRASLARTKTHHFDAGSVHSVGDLGDLEIPPDGSGTAAVGDVQESVRATMASVYEHEVFPIVLGGDNSLTYANAAPLLSLGSVGVVNLDAHLDVREVRDGPTSGTPYRQLFEDGLDAYVCVGARHFETSTAYHDYVREQGGSVLTAETVAENPALTASTALETLGDVDLVYVSVDCDVLDVSAAPGVSAPTPGGLSTRELYVLLRHLASDDRLAGFEIVECAPRLDRDSMTSDAAARAVAHVLAGRVATPTVEVSE